MSNRLDLAGQRYGQLEVVYRNPEGKWLCLCDCGGQSYVKTGNLRSGNSRSCGCLGRAKQTVLHTSHKGTGTRLHNIWLNMKSRCGNPNNPKFKHYGKRGISVCEDWSDFVVFRDWALTNGYSDELSIERKDNDLGYSPDNCTWIPFAEQRINQRRTKLTPDDIPLIRVMANEGVLHRKIASMFNVNKALISAIMTNRAWVHA